MSSWLAESFRQLTSPPQPTPGERAIAHLREWLSPEQLEMFDRFGEFFVRGSHTGALYRISRHHATYNVSDMDGQRYCFVEEKVPTGDNLLTQKILLEHDEEAALRIANVKRVEWFAARPVANRRGASGGGQNSRFVVIEYHTRAI